MESLVRDVRIAIRSNLRDAGFAATVVITLLVCVAANTLTFAVVNSVLLRPLPVPDAGSIVLLANRYPNAGAGDSNESAAGDYIDRQSGVPGLADQALIRRRAYTLDIDGVAERAAGMTVTPSFFQLVRTAPALGRAFTAAEGEPGGERKVILSHGLWQKLYAGRAEAIGQALRLDGQAFEVTGVMPAQFNFINPEVRLWTPLALTAAEKLQHHSNNYYNAGRMKPGVSIEQVQSQVDALNHANLERDPATKDLLVSAGFHTRVEPLQHMLVKGVEGALYLLWAAALLVLFIGGLNVANLALARLASRRREMATRLALGATRAQLTRQAVTENVLISTFGGLLGVGAAYLLLPVMAEAGIDKFPRAGEVRIDGFVALVSLAISAAVGVVMGLLPPSNSMRTNRTGTQRIRRALVVAEVGFAFVLLVGAGLFLSSFRNLLRVDPGFQSFGVITASTNAPAVRYPNAAALRTLLDRLLESIRKLPGVAAVGATTSIPLGGSFNDSVILAEGYAMKPGESVISPKQQTITPGYFQAMRMPMARGRDFTERDHEKADPAIIIDERLARRFWADRDPVGQRMYSPQSPSELTPNANTRWVRVVGVVRSIRLEDLTAKQSMGAYYFPHAQDPSRGFTLAVRTAAGAGDLTRAIRAEVARIDPMLALFDIRTMTERTELSLSSRKTSMTLAMAFGALALFLSATGIYGVLAFLVTQRRREIGIRVALGSTRARVVRLVVREGLLLAGAGLAAGLAGSAAMQRAVANEVYGVEPLDPLVLGVVMTTLAGVSLMACVVPARRALRVDPMTVLQE